MISRTGRQGAAFVAKRR